MNLPLHSILAGPAQQVLDTEASVSNELVDAGCLGLVTAHFDSTLLAGDSVLVRGKASGHLASDCGRCLEKVDQNFEVRFHLLIEKSTDLGCDWMDQEDAGVEDYQLRIGPDVTEISLDHIIAEQVLLNYNLHPLPALDAQNRCIKCGLAAPEVEGTRKADRVDPRWNRLKSLQDAAEGETGPRPPEAS